jgi:hypothetical protein
MSYFYDTKQVLGSRMSCCDVSLTVLSPLSKNTSNSHKVKGLFEAAVIASIVRGYIKQEWVYVGNQQDWDNELGNQHPFIDIRLWCSYYFKP